MPIGGKRATLSARGKLKVAATVPASTATANNAAGAPTQADFNALVAAHNTQVANFNALLTSLKNASHVSTT